MKYVMFKLPDGRELPVLFPEALVHADVAAALRRVRELRLAVPVAAGTAQMVCLVTCGRSETLNRESRREDRDAITAIDYTHGHDTGSSTAISNMIFKGIRRGR